MKSCSFPCYDLVSPEAAEGARAAFQAALEELAAAGEISSISSRVAMDDWGTPQTVLCEWSGNDTGEIEQVLGSIAQPFYEQKVLLAPYDYQ